MCARAASSPLQCESKSEIPSVGAVPAKVCRENASGTIALMKTRSHALLIEQIRELSSTDLGNQIRRLADQEHVQVARLIAHLAEVSRRGLHLGLGYSSLFEFCVEHLGLSEGSAALRIQVGRVCLRHPVILDALADRRISLTVAGKLAPHLTVSNRERLIADCTGKTKREVEEYLVHLAPRPTVSSGARKRSASGSVEPCQPGLFNVRFVAGQEFMDKLERAAEVGHIAKRNLAEVLERSLDAYLSKHDPAVRQARREKRGAGQARREKRGARQARLEKRGARQARREQPAARLGTAALQPITAAGTRRSAGSARSIPASLRDLLFIRADHRCEFLGSDGHRCSERSYLTIDHIVPWALGGPSEAGNLRVLCAAHNRFAADRCFSAGFMKHKIEAARCKAGGGRPRPDEVGMPDEVCEPAPVYGRRRTTVFAVSAIRSQP